MKVTVRDVKHPDVVIHEFLVRPHLGLPYVGTQLRLPRVAYQARQQVVRVVDYVWDLVADDSGDLEIRMLVADDRPN